MLTALKLPFDLTMDIQCSVYTLSDFYGGWLEMTHQLEKLTKNDGNTVSFARTLLDATKKREPSLLNNSTMLAAVYLDPRYMFKLTAEEVRIAKMVLQKLYERVQRAKSKSPRPPNGPENVEDSFEELCVAAGFERTYFEGDSISPTTLNNKTNNQLEDMFEEYEKIKRVHRRYQIIPLWHELATEHPVLYELACILQAIPPSQTIVERAFSLFGFIFNCRRTQLLPQTLEDLLMINLNRDMVESIHQRDLDALP